MTGMRVTFSVAVGVQTAAELDKYSEQHPENSRSEIVEMAIKEFLKNKEG